MNYTFRLSFKEGTQVTFFSHTFLRKAFVASLLCKSLNWKMITLVIFVHLNGSR